jgi:hypothetical protein
MSREGNNTGEDKATEFQRLLINEFKDLCYLDETGLPNITNNLANNKFKESLKEIYNNIDEGARESYLNHNLKKIVDALAPQMINYWHYYTMSPTIASKANEEFHAIQTTELTQALENTTQIPRSTIFTMSVSMWDTIAQLSNTRYMQQYNAQGTQPNPAPQQAQLPNPQGFHAPNIQADPSLLLLNLENCARIILPPLEQLQESPQHGRHGPNRNSRTPLAAHAHHPYSSSNAPQNSRNRSQSTVVTQLPASQHHRRHQNYPTGSHQPNNSGGPSTTKSK